MLANGVHSFFPVNFQEACSEIVCLKRVGWLNVITVSSACFLEGCLLGKDVYFSNLCLSVGGGIILYIYLYDRFWVNFLFM